MCNCKANKFVNREHKIQWCSNCLETKPYRRRWTYLSYVIGVILFLCLVFRWHTAGVHKPVQIYDIPIREMVLTDSVIAVKLVENDCVLPSIAVAQARIETGNYKSKVCIENKNLFGIKKHPCKYVSGELNDHAVFKSYEDCIKCYCEIQRRYLKSIDGKYAEDGNYVSVIKQMK